MAATKRDVTILRIIWTISAATLLCGAVLSLLTPSSKLLSITTLLGVCMLLAGFFDTMGYVFHHKVLHGGQWLLCEGLIMALLSLFLIFNDIIFAEFVPFLFGVWELVSGVLKSAEASTQKDAHIKGWQSFLCIGIIEVLSGMLALTKTIEITLTTSVTIGIVLAIQAAAFTYKIVFAPRLVNKSEIISQDSCM